jgi:hypothetical protein
MLPPVQSPLDPHLTAFAETMASDMSATVRPEPRAGNTAARRENEDLEADAERGRSEDPARGRRVRALTVSAAAVVLASFAAAGTILYPDPADYDDATLISGASISGLFVLIVLYVFRQTLMATAFNRRAAALVVVAAFAVPILHLGSIIGQLDPVWSQTHALVIYATITAVAGFVLDRRFGFSAALFVAGDFVAVSFPSTRMIALSVGAMAVAVTIWWVWSGRST